MSRALVAVGLAITTAHRRIDEIARFRQSLAGTHLIATTAARGRWEITELILFTFESSDPAAITVAVAVTVARAVAIAITRIGFRFTRT